jgi:signal transduction histidine kinase
MSAWFVVGCGATLLLLGWLTYRLRVRSLERQKQLLERDVRSRTAELADAVANLDRERSELRQLNGQYLDANQQLEASLRTIRETQAQLVHATKMAAVGQLAAGVSHEINNPLSIILGFAKSMEKRLGERDQQFRLPVESILREAVRCRNLIQELLTFSRAAASTMELVNVPAVLRGARNALEPRARAQATQLRLDLGESIPPMKANPDQLEQVLVNLAQNALDAQQRGGEVVLRLRRYAELGVLIEVEDDGPGIPEDIRYRIFEPFFTTKEVGQGTGLGLSLVYEIIQQHGGAIEVVSEVGQGTTMRVIFPGDPPRPYGLGAQTPAPEPEAGGKTTRNAKP